MSRACWKRETRMRIGTTVTTMMKRLQGVLTDITDDIDMHPFGNRYVFDNASQGGCRCAKKVKDITGLKGF